jgi:hypothetical protein
VTGTRSAARPHRPHGLGDRVTYVVLRHAMLYAKTVPAAALEFASRSSAAGLIW